MIIHIYTFIIHYSCSGHGNKSGWTDGKETEKGQPAGCMSHGRVNGKVNGLPTLIMSVWGYVPIDNRFRTRF